MIRGIWSVFLICLALPAAGAAADLTGIDRTIAKEPAYRGRPRYCLVVFGPGTAGRVWLALDGDTLYADKNGNGDLTEAGEKVIATHDRNDGAFSVGTVRFGGLEHRNLTVRGTELSAYGGEVTGHPVSKAALAADKAVKMMSVSADAQVPGLSGGDDGRVSFWARLDASGPLLFAETPAAAPVLHFGGPLHVNAEERRPELYAGRVHDLMLTVGSRGVGPGTFSSVSYDKVIPEGAFAVVEAEFPARDAGGPPLRRRYELKERC